MNRFLGNADKRIIAILIIGAFGLGALVGIVGLLWATGGNSTPTESAADRAPTLSLTDTNVDETEAPTETEEVSTAATDVPTQEPTIAPTTEAAAPQASDKSLYRISQDESEVRFVMQETLAGNRTTVIGKTNQVGGDIIVDFANPSSSEVGQIVINARTIATDNEFRNQSIRGRILFSSQDKYEFIDFTPTELVGLPSEAVNVGDTVMFKIIGNLKVVDTTRSVTFDATVTVEAEDRLSGSAHATVLYSDFGISIQAPPTVTNIGDETELELDFVALKVNE